jgi:hypothetical protein
MKTMLFALLVAAASPALAAQGRYPGAPNLDALETEDPPAFKSLDTVLQGWTAEPRAIVRAMVASYGAPARFSDDSVVWYANAGWTRTVVYRIAAPRDKDFLEQTVSYGVPDGKVAELKRFDPRLRVDKASGRLSAQSESEPLNRLALNLAAEIVAGERSVEDARAFYRKTEELSKAGKGSPYLERLLFTVDEDRIAVPDAFDPENL